MSTLRSDIVRRLGDEIFDVLVVGGGINGAVSAACLSARGARVALIDRGDFASFTSQQSSNLAWGGIKYMESLEFGLVRKLCLSRNHLIDSYPSTVQEIRFFVTHARGFRHGLWKLVLGAWLYWLIGSFFTKRPRRLSLAAIEREEPIVRLDGCDGGFEYSDAYLHDNDARFVWGFIQSALDRGAMAANYVESIGSEHTAAGWTTRARDVTTGAEFTVRSKVVVNACGPFVDEANELAKVTTSHQHVFSKGIHLLVGKLTESRRVLTFFADDGRLFFVIPMGPRTCIGTTDTKVTSPITEVTPEDRRFVLDNINKRLRLDVPLTEADVIAERCGVRPLAVTRSAGGKGSDWMQLSRKHVVEVDASRAHVSIFGGKLTDCINVGEEIAAHVQALGVAFTKPTERWYGEPPAEERAAFMAEAERIGLDARTSSEASEPLSTRLYRRYGREARKLLDAIARDASQAELLIEGAEYIRAEIELAARREMIVKLDDFLRRRSKIALVVRREELARAAGLREACRIFFGADADAKHAEYFAEGDGSSVAP